MAKFAAALLEAAPEDIVFEGGKIMVKGAPAKAKSFAEVAAFAYIPVPLPEGHGAGAQRRRVLRADQQHLSRSAATSRCSRSIARPASRSCSG